MKGSPRGRAWLAWLFLGCAQTQHPAPAPMPAADTPPRNAPPSVLMPVGPGSLSESTAGEDRHLLSPRQVTLDGAFNAEPRLSPDGKRLVFSNRDGPNSRMRLIIMDVDGRNRRVISPPEGFSVCAVFAPDRPRVLFASTHQAPPAQRQDANALDLFEMDLDGANITPLVTSLGLDSEASFSPDGTRVLFTSTRDGQEDLYLLQRSTGAIQRLTTRGAGGGNFSPDGTQVVFRSFNADATTSELFLMNADGTGQRALTNLQATSWAPAFHPSGRFILFAANLRPHLHTPGSNFDLYLLETATGHLERITYEEGPDGLPAFTSDGATLYWTSARQGGQQQLFAAPWVD